MCAYDIYPTITGKIRCPICGTGSMYARGTWSGKYYLQCENSDCGMRTKAYLNRFDAAKSIMTANEREDKLQSDAKELRTLNISLISQNGDLHREVAMLNRTINKERVERRKATEDGICQKAGWYTIAGGGCTYITDSDERMNSIIETYRKLTDNDCLVLSDIVYLPLGAKLPKVSPGMKALFGIKEGEERPTPAKSVSNAHTCRTPRRGI